MQPRHIYLTEYQPVDLAKDDFPIPLAQTLESHYTQQVEVEPPSYKNQHRWRLTAQGWVGTIPLANHLHLYLQPKTPLHNLFAMLEYAYEWDELAGNIDRGLVQVDSLPTFFDRLAGKLARAVLERSRKGLYRAYLPQQERLPYLRGRINLNEVLRHPTTSHLPCEFEEQSSDIADNQILTWTLHQIIQTRLCSEKTLPLVRHALHGLQSVTALRSFQANDCIGRAYHRLNHDYQPLHALCRFFLAHVGPSHQAGEWTMLPFLIDMAQLFEQFVAAWLLRHLPHGWQIKRQEAIVLDVAGHVTFRPDLVLYAISPSDIHSPIPHMILDTKYKVPDAPAAGDIAQVIAYAQTKGCREAVLLYPAPLKRPINIERNGIRVRSFVFDLAQPLEIAGSKLLNEIV